MQNSILSIHTTKPLLLAGAIALALTACGGSDQTHNAPLAAQPSTPAQQNSASGNEATTPPQAEKPGAPQGESNQQSNNNSGKQPQAGGNQQPDAGGNQQPDVGGNQQPDADNATPPVIAGAAIFSTAPPTSPGTTAAINNQLKDNLFVEDSLSQSINDDGIVLSADAFSLIYSGYTLNSDQVESMELPSDGQKHVKDHVPFKRIGAPNSELEVISMVHIGKDFGYPQARAYHYYGVVDTHPFSLAYTRGELASAAAIGNLKPAANDALVYSGTASFRASSYPVDDTFAVFNENTAFEELKQGVAQITVRPAEKTLDAYIDLRLAGQKAYDFPNIAYNADTASFEHKESIEGIRGNFYGKNAEYIGGVYYVPEGSGAFMTEKQP